MEITVRERVITVLAAAAIVAGCAATGGDDAPTSLKMEPIGTPFRDAISVGDKRIPLPPGDWVLIGKQIDKNREFGFNVAQILIKTENDIVTAAIEFYANLPVKKNSDAAGRLLGGKQGPGWPTHRACSRDDMHYVKVHANTRLGDQDCWWINHWRMNRVGAAKTEHWMEAQKYLAEHRIRAPLDMVAVSFRLADKADYLTANYFFNPELSGFQPVNDVFWEIHTWETSDWHPDNVKDDPKKRSFITGLVSWGERWHKNIKAAFGSE